MKNSTAIILLLIFCTVSFAQENAACDDPEVVAAHATWLEETGYDRVDYCVHSVGKYCAADLMESRCVAFEDITEFETALGNNALCKFWNVQDAEGNVTKSQEDAVDFLYNCQFEVGNYGSQPFGVRRPPYDYTKIIRFHHDSRTFTVTDWKIKLNPANATAGQMARDRKHHRYWEAQRNKEEIECPQHLRNELISLYEMTTTNTDDLAWKLNAMTCVAGINEVFVNESMKNGFMAGNGSGCDNRLFAEKYPNGDYQWVGICPGRGRNEYMLTIDFKADTGITASARWDIVK